jgi:hypothetical protein
MTSHEPNDADAVWQRLTKAAKSLPPPDRAAAPAGFAANVLMQARAVGRPAFRTSDERRVLSWAAVFAVAASLLVAVTNWNDLSSVFAAHSQSVLFDDVTRWETLP